MTPTIGASEVATVLGLGRTDHDGDLYVSELELWSRLVGLLPRYDTAAAHPSAEVGRWFEVAIVNRLAIERGWMPGIDILPGPALHEPGIERAGIPWHARPDAIHITPGGRWVQTIEAKAPRRLYPEDWGTTVDDIPPYYAAQVLAQLAVTECETGILAAMARDPGWDGRVWATYELRREPRREAAMVGAVLAWLERHVERRMPPQPDGSDSATRTLRRVFTPLDDRVRVATPTDLERYHRMLASKDAADEAMAAMRLEQQHLQQAMAEATVLTDERGTNLVTWRPDKNGVRRWRNLEAL